MSSAAGPEVSDGWVTFRLADAENRWESVQLSGDSALARGGRAMLRAGDAWEITLPRPDLDRIEYQFVAKLPADRGGWLEWLTDPANPRTVETAFGQMSVLELPGYAPPAWLALVGVKGRSDQLYLPAEDGALGEELPVTVWSPSDAAADEPLPLLLANDGPEYDHLASLTHFSAVQIALGTVPRHRLALLQPVRRDDWYSASPEYLTTLTGPLPTFLRDRYAVSGPLVVMGASLGGLTSVLAGLRDASRPGRDGAGVAGGADVEVAGIGGVFSQSGSFFQPAHDTQERGYSGFARISTAVGEILDGRRATRHTGAVRSLRVAMTCGALEENAANNRDMASALRRAGHDVRLDEGRDLHNYTAWRDSFDPSLTMLLRECWGAPV